jgi:DNA-binding transcriptional LysR family regulator
VDLDAVRTFVAVADTGRFAEAADDLSITRQAVSKRVAALERDLGVRLFDASFRAVTRPALRSYLGAAPPRRRGAGTWTPSWARRPARTPRQVTGS